MIKTLISRTTQLGCLFLLIASCNRTSTEAVKPAPSIDEASVANSIAQDEEYIAFRQEQKALYVTIKKGILALGEKQARNYATQFQSGQMTNQRLGVLLNEMLDYKLHQAQMASKLVSISTKYALKGSSQETIGRIFTLADNAYQTNPGNTMKVNDCPCSPDPDDPDEGNDPPQNPDNGDGPGGNGDGSGGDTGGGGGGGGGGWSPPGQSALQQALTHCYSDANLIQKAILYIGYCSGSSDPAQCIQDKLTDAGLDYAACVLSQLSIPF